MSWVPTTLQTERLLAYSENGKAFASQVNKLRDEYAGQYVVFADQHVVLADTEPRNLIKAWKGAYTSAARSTMFIAYVPAVDEVLLV